IVGDSAGANNGTVVGGAQWVAGPDGFGNALLFDGTGSQYVDLGTYNPSSGELTLALWAKWDGLSGSYQGLMGKRDTWAAANMMWQIEANIDNGTLGFFREGSSPYDGDPVLPVGEWAHVAVSFDGTDAVFYVNGRETGRGAFSYGDKTDSALVFGACEANGGNPFNGALDEVRIYNRGLSEAEIAYVISDGAPTLHVPVISVADLYDQEPEGSKALNFKDFAVLADEWLDEQLWPEW
ncbi:MAG: LamG domain-containing protein, partial [Planctomycetota bacterium]